MANYFNIYSAVLSFVVASAVTYGLWTPINDFLSYFPIGLYVLCTASWISLVFGMCFYFPSVMLVGDDHGR